MVTVLVPCDCHRNLNIIVCNHESLSESIESNVTKPLLRSVLRENLHVANVVMNSSMPKLLLRKMMYVHSMQLYVYGIQLELAL